MWGVCSFILTRTHTHIHTILSDYNPTTPAAAVAAAASAATGAAAASAAAAAAVFSAAAALNFAALLAPGSLRFRKASSSSTILGGHRLTVLTQSIFRYL